MMSVRITRARAVGTGTGAAEVELAARATVSQQAAARPPATRRIRTLRDLMWSRPLDDVEHGPHAWIGLLAVLELRINAALPERLQVLIEREQPFRVWVRPVGDSAVSHAMGEGEQELELRRVRRHRGR